MESKICFCGWCQEGNKSGAGLEVQDGRWLEELGDMIEAAVEGMKKKQTTDGCYGRWIGA